MSHNDDMQHQTANAAITALHNIGYGTDQISHHLERWNRVRNASRNARTPDAAPLWAAIADGDQKATAKAAQEYATATAILNAAKADTRREDTYRAATMSAIKTTVKDALDTARAQFNDAATEYTSAFHDAGNQPDPSQLIVTDGGAELWADLIRAAQDMNAAAAVLKLAHQFGIKANDQATGLIDQVPYATNLPDIQAVARAKTTDWLTGKEHAAHRDWAVFLLAGGELYAGTIPEQEAEVQRLIDQAQDGRKQKMIPDMIADTEKRALARAAKKALKGQA